MSRRADDVSVIRNDGAPVTWTVEAANTDRDGGYDVTIFSGPDSEIRAREYAEQQYIIEGNK